MLPRRPVRFGLWPRLAVLCAASVLMAALVPAWLSYLELRKVILRDLRVRATAVSQAAASNGGFCLSGAETECRQLTKMLLEITDVAWAFVVDANGEIPPGASAQDARLGPEGFRRVRYQGPIRSRPTPRRVVDRGVEYLAILVPIPSPEGSDVDLFLGGGTADRASGPEGAVELGFRLDTTTRILNASLWRAFGITAAVVAGALLFAAFFARLLTQPLLRMARATETVARGDLRAMIPVDSQDEIGLLSETFNAMIVAMRSSFERMNASATRIDRAAAELVETMSLQRVGAGANLATVSATMATLTEIVASSAEAERRGRAAMDLAQRAVASSEHVAAAGQRALEEAVAELERAEPHVQAVAARVRELGEGASSLGEVVDTVAAFADRFHDLSMQVSQQAVEIVGAPPTTVEATLQGVVSAARAHAREAQRAATGVRRTVGHVLQEIRRTGAGAEEAMRVVEGTIARVRDGKAAVEGRGSGPRDGARASRQIAELIQEQLDQMEEVLRGVENVRRATTQFHSAADQTLSTAKALTRVSAEMKELLSSYRVS